MRSLAVSIPAMSLAVVVLANLDADVLQAGDLFEDHGTYVLDTKVPDLDFIGITAGDFNGDGALDVAGPLRYQDVVVFIRDPADGDWDAGRSLTEEHGEDFGWATAGDLDSDGVDDLVVVVPCSTLRVFMGSRSNALRDLPPGDAGSQVCELALADLDGDGVLDLYGRRRLDTGGPPATVVLHGNGDGTFGPPVEFPIPYPDGASHQAILVRAADFDGDGRPDLASAVTDGITTRMSILLAGGAPPEAWTTTLPAPVVAIDASDIDHDGKADLAVATVEKLGPPSGASTVSVFQGIGGGSLGPAPVLSLPGPILDLAAKDLDGDGDEDLVAVTPAGRLLAFRQTGPFAFEPVSPCVAGPFPPVLIDVDGDGKTDALFPGSDTAGGTPPLLLRGKGDGTFRAANADYEVPVFVPSALGDIDGDHIPDLVIAQFIAPARPPTNFGTVIRIDVLRGDGRAGFLPPAVTTFDPGNPASALDALLADVDGDGRPDLVLVTQAPGKQEGLAVLHGIGDGTFRAPFFTPAAGSLMLARDLDGDGRAEVLVLAGGFQGSTDADRKVLIFKEGASGALEVAARIAEGLAPRSFGLGDVDGDGIADMVIHGLVNDLGGRGFIELPGRSDGSFGTPVKGDPRELPWDSLLTLADWNGDGKPDVIVPGGWFPGLGGGGFGDLQSFDLPPAPGRYRVADLDGDGKLDIVLPGDNLRVFLGDGMGGVSTEVIAGGPGSRDVLVADLDGDGAPDVVSVGTLVAVYRNRPQAAPFIRGEASGDGVLDLTDAVVVLGCLFLGSGCPVCTAAADANADGRVDLTDPIAILAHLFLGGPPPPAPFPACALGAGVLPCPSHPACPR